VSGFQEYSLHSLDADWPRASTYRAFEPIQGLVLRNNWALQHLKQLEQAKH